MKAMTAADELAMVRTRIAQLQAREAELRDVLIDTDPLGRVGRWTEARVIEHRVRHFDHRLLPFELQVDPLFWREKVKTDIALALRDGGDAAAPGTRASRRRSTLGFLPGVMGAGAMDRGSRVEGPGLSAADVAVIMHDLPH